jgi:hypothetical protein
MAFWRKRRSRDGFIDQYSKGAIMSDAIILNLTQHPATPEQIAAGVVDLIGDNLEALKALLTFEDINSTLHRHDRAEQLAKMVADIVLQGNPDYLHEDGTAIHCMIGGAPFLMGPLEAALLKHNRVPVYAFSVRESVEEPQPDGSVKKINVFKHGGFVS